MIKWQDSFNGAQASCDNQKSCPNDVQYYQQKSLFAALSVQKGLVFKNLDTCKENIEGARGFRSDNLKN